jgi:hypothetical protein
MLQIQSITSKFRIVAMSVTEKKQYSTYNVQVRMFTIYVPVKFHMPRSNGSPVTDIRPKAI